jgi:hypothetical protein
LFGDDGVGINIGAVERGDQGGDLGKGFHTCTFGFHKGAGRSVMSGAWKQLLSATGACFI